MASQISLKPVIARRQQRPDGTYNVKIRVTYKRVSRFLSTTITAAAKDVDRDGNLRGRPLALAYTLIGHFQDYINELNYFLAQSMDVDDVIKYIRQKGGVVDFKLDFFDFAEKEVLPTKTDNTMKTYVSALNTLKRYLHRDEMDINELTKSMLLDFTKFVDNEPKNVGGKLKQPTASKIAKKKGYTATVYLTKLRYIYNAAVQRYNDEDSGITRIPRNPFSGITATVKSDAARTALAPEIIQRLIDLPDKSGHVGFAVDVYLISFALMGMNTVDMLEALPDDNGIITYNRAKTRARRQDHAEHRVKIDPRIAALVEKYRDKTGRCLFDFYQRFSSASQMNHHLTYSLKAVAKILGVDRFTIYSARHSWATIARSSRCGIDKATVDDCLVHVGDHRMVDVYAEKDWSVYWAANEKVLDVFDWTAVQ